MGCRTRSDTLEGLTPWTRSDTLENAGTPGVSPVLRRLGVFAGKTRLSALMPCVTALNFDRTLPSSVLWPVLF